MIGVWVGLIGAAAVLFPFYKEARKPDIDDTVRANAPGAFADLSDGKTHYQWHGDVDGPVLVCVHGLTTPSYVWDEMMPGLIAAGYRVLTYDLYGRGFSDRPKGAQTRAFFIRQLRDLLDALGVQDGFHLMGYSMGGSIVSVFVDAEPKRAGRLILLAPAGMEHGPSSLVRLAVKIPVLGEWLFYSLYGKELVAGTKKLPNPRLAEKQTAHQIAELGRKGYMPAVLSSLRNMLAERLQGAHHQIAQDGLPVMAIWGGDDTVIPISAKDILAKWNPDVTHIVVDGAGHAVGITHPDQVNAALKRV